MEASGIRIHHPNREKPQSKATKAGVVMLLLVSAALIAIIFVGGYSQLAGAKAVAVAWVVIYVVMAYFVAARWSRGVLPLAAGLAILFTTFAVVGAPAWFARDKPGLDDPLLPSGLLGLLMLVLIAVQVLLILFAMRGFQQEWNVEIEVRDDEYGYEGSEGPTAADQEQEYAEEPQDYQAPDERTDRQEPSRDQR